MARQCNCLTKVNKKLLEQNLQIDSMFVLVGSARRRTRKYMHVPAVATLKVNNDKRTKRRTVVPSHCPFCGKKYPELGP